MIGLGHHPGKDGDEGGRSHGGNKEEAVPRDRLRHYVWTNAVMPIREIGPKDL